MCIKLGWPMIRKRQYYDLFNFQLNALAQIASSFHDAKTWLLCAAWEALINNCVCLFAFQKHPAPETFQTAIYRTTVRQKLMRHVTKSSVTKDTREMLTSFHWFATEQDFGIIEYRFSVIVWIMVCFVWFSSFWAPFTQVYGGLKFINVP